MNQVRDLQKRESYRFEIYAGVIGTDGRFAKARTVGHAYLRAGAHAYKAKLFGALSERFVIVPTDEADRYRILTKEEVQTKDKGKRTYWNVVGLGQIMSPQGLLKLDFDLYGKPLFMNLYPSSAGDGLAIQSTPELAGAA